MIRASLIRNCLRDCNTGVDRKLAELEADDRLGGLMVLKAHPVNPSGTSARKTIRAIDSEADRRHLLRSAS